MTSAFSRTNSTAISANRSMRPSAQRYSIATVRPSVQPSSRNRCTKAATIVRGIGRVAAQEADGRHFAGCCARAASGHALTPPTSVMNSRRLICCPQSEDCTLPHRGRKYRVVHHSKLGGQMS